VRNSRSHIIIYVQISGEAFRRLRVKSFLPVATVVQRLCSRNVDFNSRSLTLGFKFWPYAVLHGAYLHNQTPSSTSAIVPPYERRMDASRLWETDAFSDASAMQKYPMRKRKSRLKNKFEQHCRTVSLECNPKCLTWRLVTFATYDMSSLTSTSSPLMDQDHENSSQKKKWITTLSQLTLTAILNCSGYLTQIPGSQKKPSQGCSHAPSPSYAPEDDDVPDDVHLNPQTTDGRSAPHKFSRKP
jgi:hypothetical protein